jgi:hypothetical protein
MSITRICWKTGTIAIKEANNDFIQQAALLMGVANDMSTKLTIAQDLLCREAIPTMGVSAWLQNFKARNFESNLKPFRQKFLLSRDDNRPHFLLPSSVADVQRLNNVLDSFQQLSPHVVPHLSNHVSRYQSLSICCWRAAFFDTFFHASAFMSLSKTHPVHLCYGFRPLASMWFSHSDVSWVRCFGTGSGILPYI